MDDGWRAGGSALVDTAWVLRQAHTPGIRLVEVDIDTTAHESGHVPGAIGWNWERDLQSQPTRDIPSVEQWEDLLGRSGITNDTFVVLYGDHGNWFAAYAYWLLRYYGHRHLALMDGGRQKWIGDHLPIDRTQPEVEPAAYRVREIRHDLRAHRADVEQALRSTGTALVDVRSPQEFSGALIAPIDMPQEGAQRGGHIPGAANVPWVTAVAADGSFRPVAELAAAYGGQELGATTPIITYCRIGERSSHTWFVLTELLKLPNVRNYDGSWTEWGSLVGAPIERGLGPIHHQRTGVEP